MDKKDKRIVKSFISLITFTFLTLVFSKLVYDYTSVLEVFIFNPIHELKVLCYIFMALTVLIGVLFILAAIFSGIGFLYFTAQLFCLLFNIESGFFGTTEKASTKREEVKKYQSQYTGTYIKFE